MEKPFIWQMIKEAIDTLNGKASYSEIRNYINSKWGNVKESTINAQIIVLCVNHSSRIHYPENKKPRISNTQYDILFSIGRGQVVKYNSEVHGIWEISQNEFGALSVNLVTYDDELPESAIEESDSFLFPIEAHLRDFLIHNLHSIKDQKLELYVNDEGQDGKEYPTKVGRIDILTIDEEGNFVVFELKLLRGPDKAIGQVLRYMGWVKENIAKGKMVKGIIVAKKLDEKIKFAASIVPDITLYEYDMQFKLLSHAK